METLLSFCHPVRFPRQCITLFFSIKKKKVYPWNVILEDITFKVVIHGLAITNLLYIYAQACIFFSANSKRTYWFDFSDAVHL